jgi:hypothetical protein
MGYVLTRHGIGLLPLGLIAGALVVDWLRRDRGGLG